jgi:hypothetical protein
MPRVACVYILLDYFGKQAQTQNPLSADSGLMLEKLLNAVNRSPALSVVGGFPQERKSHHVDSDDTGKSVTTESGSMVATA